MARILNRFHSIASCSSRYSSIVSGSLRYPLNLHNDCNDKQYLITHHSIPLQHQQHRYSSSNQTVINNDLKSTSTTMTAQEMSSLQTKLFQEATYLTRTLYRKCLQSIKVIAKGNTRDEDDFIERETKERDQFDTSKIDLNERISMDPPVNRQNELSSRSEYYKTFTRENFDGHYNLLGKHGFHIGDEGNMRHGLGVDKVVAENQSQKDNNDDECYTWREDQIEQFIYLIKSGEEKRQWILNDYEFDDPCEDWPTELRSQLSKFERQSTLLVKEMYHQKGWISKSETHADDDGFFSDSDSDDDR